MVEICLIAIAVVYAAVKFGSIQILQRSMIEAMVYVNI